LHGQPLAAGALSTLTLPMMWNAILRATHARQFLTDAPIAINGRQ
jgi:hypothetical protein